MISAVVPPDGLRRTHSFGASFRTPLNGAESAFWSMNLPVAVSRLVQFLVTGLKVCDRPLTAPTRALSPVGWFVAIVVNS